VIDKAAQRRSRIKLIGVLLIFAGPLFLAFVWLQMVKSGAVVATSTHGELISPARPLSAFELQDVDGKAFGPDQLNSVWTLLYFTRGQCSERCETNLYHMRQVRLSLNKNMTRVQRVAVVSGSSDISSELLTEHPGLTAVSGSASAVQAFATQFEQAESSLPVIKDAIYLVDPLGNLMMRFPPDLNPKSMLEDLKHLLKVSRIG